MGAIGLLAAGALILPLPAFEPTVSADAGDGTISVHVIRDVGADGAYNAAFDVDVAGIPVRVSDDSGASVNAVTNGAGLVTINPSTLTGGRYRVEASIPASMPFLREAQVSTTVAPAVPLSPHVAFVNVAGGASASLTMGVWNPSDFSGPAPRLVMTSNLSRLAAEDLSSGLAVVEFGYSDRGVNGTDFNAVPHASQGQVGATYGVASHPSRSTVLVGASAKVNVEFGPGGNGAIYAVPVVGQGASVFATVPNVGTSAHSLLPDARDSAIFYAAGRESLGDIELSEDGTTVYAVNLFTRSLIVLNAATGAIQQTIPITDPGCANSNDWRPYGLGYQDAKLYVGGVCSAETSGNNANLRAVVYEVNPAAIAFGTPILMEPMDHPRGTERAGQGTLTWNAWTDNPDDWIRLNNGGNDYYPYWYQPMLTDIEKTPAGDLILGFRNRMQDQISHGSLDPRPGNPSYYFPDGGGGDINKVCLVGGTYVWEGGVGCDVPPSQNPGQGPSVVEFYSGDHFNGVHQELAQGGLVYLPGFANVVMAATDPLQSAPYYQGVRFLNNVTGGDAGGLAIQQNTTPGSFLKGSGMGDLEALAAPAPIEIGNRVWFDTDRDGQQDPTEAPIPGVIVELYQGTTLIGTTVTDAQGHYYFGGSSNTGLLGVQPLPTNSFLTVRIPNATGGSQQPPLAGHEPTVTDSGPNGTDSDGVPSGTNDNASVLTGGPGENNHSYDFGFVALVPSVDIEKGDTGPQGAATSGVLINDADTATDAQGYEPGETRDIVFDVTNDGQLPLYNVSVTDDSFSGVNIAALRCVFPGQVAPGTAGVLTAGVWRTTWNATYGNALPSPTAWNIDVTFQCTATLTLDGTDVPHMNHATVITNLTPTGTPATGTHEGPTDEDDYYAFTGEIQVIKYDGNRPDPTVGSGPNSWTPPTKPLADAGQDANTPGLAVPYPAGVAQPVRWVVTNTGATWLADITLADTTGDAPAVGAWVCNLSPVGGPAIYSFTSDGPWAGPLAPGASFFCEGPLTLPTDDTHADVVDVEGTVVVPVLDEDGIPVLDDDGVPTYETDDDEPVRSNIVVIDDDPFHARTGAVDIEKGDSGPEGAASPGVLVNDADTSTDSQGYEPGETREIVFEVTNPGSVDLYNVTITDDTLAGDAVVNSLRCVFPGQAGPGTAGTLAGNLWTVHWAQSYGDALPAPLAWIPDMSFPCYAELTLTGTDAPHMDRAAVITNLSPNGTPATGPHEGPGDEDDYYAYSGDIQVIKYDGNLADPVVGAGPNSWTPPAKPLVNAAQDANTPALAVAYPADVAQPVRWVVTNTGATWLADITLADTTGDGPDVGAWVCDLTPVGGPSGYSFTDDGEWVGPLAPGASFFCEGPLTLPANDSHADTVDVEGTVVVPVLDEDGIPVLDDDGVPTYETDEDEPVRSNIVVIDDDPFHAATGLVDIEKGDTGSVSPGALVNDADTSDTGQAYEPGETREIVFDVTNNGLIGLYNVTVTDDTLAGNAIVSGLRCVFPGQAAPGTFGTLTGNQWAVHWVETYGDAPSPVAWAAGVTFSCHASLTLMGTDAPHMDHAAVITHLRPTGSPGSGPHEGPGDEDDYYAFTGDIQVIKYDGNRADPAVGSGPNSWTPPSKPLVDASQDANTPGLAVPYLTDVTQTVSWVVTNTGATWLADITLADTTSDSPAVGAWVCDLTPVGGPSGYSFVTSGPWAGPLAPGASFFCRGPLTLGAADTHADTVAVKGTVVVPVLGENGVPVLDGNGVPTYEIGPEGPVRSDIVVTDDDPFHAFTPSPPTPPSSGVLPSTGTSQIITILSLTMLLLAGGAFLRVVARRRRAGAA